MIQRCKADNATAALKSMLIIPRTPTPPPPEERDVSQLSHEEMVEHMRELQRLVREGKVSSALALG